jgi:general secretion pathway protein G
MPSKRAYRRLGFSLIELLLVITILGILAALVIPRIQAPADTAKVKVRTHQIAELNTLIETYYVQVGSWPTVLTDLVPNYLPDGVPVDPSGGSYSINGTSHRVDYTP